jgi:thiamine pyrophosphate-dependent acetolactate synthase large subunit-like protein
MELFAQTDLVVAIGLRNTEVLQAKSFHKPLIILDQVDDGLADGFGADVLLVSDEVDLVLNVFDELQTKSWGAEEILKLISRMRQHLLDVEWLPATCFDALNHLPFPYASVLDTGSFCTIGEHLWLASSTRYFMGSSNGRFMGTAVPSAIGLAIGRPGLPVFCVVGDGGMSMYPAEIKLAVQQRLSICFILMTDGLYGSVACVPQVKPMSNKALTIAQPSWFRTIEAMGCEGYQVSSRDMFTETVQAWERKGPLFIEAPFDPSLYGPMTNSLR